MKKTDLKRKTISLRLKSDEVNLLRKAAAKQGQTLSSWIRQALLKSVS